MEPFEPRDYQIEGIAHLLRYRRALIPLPGGTGKSYIPMKASKELKVGSITILCSGNALYTWVKNITLHRPDLLDSTVVIENMTPARRHQIWKDPKVKVIIAKARSFHYDWPHVTLAPSLLILDEPQKFMRKRLGNSKKPSPTIQAIHEYAQQIPNVAVLTGSPESKGRQDLFPILQLLHPYKYPSYWRYVNQYLQVVRGPFGMEIEGPINTHKFREYTNSEIYRPSLPITGLPPIIRQTLPIEMQPKQRELYNTLLREMFIYKEDGSLLMTSNILAKVTRLRQILCCPKIIDPQFPEYGAGIEATLDHMAEDPDSRSHAVWFTPFTDAIPFMQERLKNEGYRKQVIFRHGMSSNDMKECEEFFRANPDSVAICSILFAQSYELETGNPGYFIGYSFDPEDNKQSEWRLRRLTTTNAFVNCYYLHNLNTYDDRQLTILSDKTLNTRVDMQDMHNLQKLLTPEQK